MLREIASYNPQLMGIVNVTPDSFSDGGRFLNAAAAVEQALRLEDEGADILDIGGESTRPGSETVSVENEIARVIPVLEALSDRVEAKISIDTRKAEVMRQAIEVGVDIVNDVSALSYDKDSLSVVAACDVQIVLMHAQGDPKTMQAAPHYGDVVSEVYGYLADRTALCIENGIAKDRIVIDPGIGFGKTLDHNLALMASLDRFQDPGLPVMLGASRKSMISMITGEKDPERRLPGSLALALLGLEKGVQILRVHDVRETKQAVEVWRSCHNV